MYLSRATKAATAFAAGALAALAGLSSSYILPLENGAIQYAERPVDDPVARLQQKVSSGEVKLEFDETHGYLPSVLRALNVQLESQVLVFSKTSFQAPRISPRMPRALYFNDTTSVGFVRGGDVLELAAQDPRQGVIFYTLDQEESRRPRFERRDSCLQCHQSGGTLGVPGLFVSSVLPESSGMPLFQFGTRVVNQETPIEKRWGGWYVTGTHGKQIHRGNSIVPNKERHEELAEIPGRFDEGAYLSPHSDIVALMVLEHQTHMTNLITRVGFEARMAVYDSEAINKALGRPEEGLSESGVRRVNNATEELLEYMLFSKEASIGDKIEGNSGFAQAFAKAGPRDSKGRSLRDLDLTKRLFRYPCSYMIYSEAFDNMPEVVRERLYRRLKEVLRGGDAKPTFAHLTAEDRQAIFEVVTATKKNLPDWWAE